jgi:Golgi phosphoprotein 3 (GPP34)
VDLPSTLHGQLYLLAYDRNRHHFDGGNRPLFGFALRAAMLTDLYLTGYLEDKGGKPCQSRVACPDDPVLRAVFERIGVISPENWAGVFAENPKRAIRDVRDQLQATGWLWVQRHWMLGMIPTTRLALYDEDMVSSLADRVTEALHNAIDGLQADPRPLAVGLLGVLGQMPTVFSFDESSRHRQELRELTLAAIEPILGLHQAVLAYCEDRRMRSFGY